MFYHYFFAFIAALTSSFFTVPFSIFCAKKMGIIDQPGERKVHLSPIPRAGGIGIAFAFYIGLLSVWLIFPSFSKFLDFNYEIYFGSKFISLLSVKKQFFGVLLGSFLVFLIGLYDDKYSLKAKHKFVLQLLSCVVAMLYGVRLFGFTLPWDKSYFELPIFLGQIITVIWLTGFMNTINLMDGLDGLAAGISAIASGTFLVVCILQGQTEIIWFSKQLKLAGVLSAALCGSCIGFLWFNFFPSRTFMGDCGALFLGFLLASIMVIGTLKTTAFFSIIIPIVILAIPVLDVFLAIYRRLRSGREIFAPDRDHLHHRFLHWGWSHREAVLMIYVLCMILSIISILLTVFKGKI